MKLLSADQVFAAEDREYAEVPTPEWADGDEDAGIRLQSLSGRERDKFEASMTEAKGNGKMRRNLDNLRARLIALCAVNEDGSLMFKSSGQVEMLGNKNVKPLQRLFDKCQELSGMSDDDVEELTKDFVKAPDEASTSDSLILSE